LARAFEVLGQPKKAIEVQKEAARIAREGGRTDAFNSLVDALLLRAPQDEVVRQLAAHRGPPSTVSAVPVSRGGSIEVVLEDADEVVAEDSQVEAPFALRHSQHPVDGARPSARPQYASSNGSGHPVDPATRMKQLLAKSEVLRRAKQYDQAIQALRLGV